jgi:hypothetical protein
MASVASQPPVRTPSGGTTDQIFQPLADCGNGNPAFYHQFFDDLDQAVSFNATAGTGTYTTTGTSATWASVSPGVGGQGKLSTEAVTLQIAEIQLPSPSFSQNIAPKKLFFETRVVANTNAANSKWIFGLVDTGAAFTAATGAVAVTDGIYFLYVGSTGILTLNQATGSVVSSVTIPAAAYNVANAFDIAFYQNRIGDILAYVDTQLVGFVPQSNIGTTGNPQNAGAVARILGTSYTATAVVLTPTIAIWETGGTASTLTLDFIDVQQER